MKRPNPILDYSSPAEEHQRERSAEEDRLKRLELYNESTFGERRPIAAAFVRLALLISIAALLIWTLPRSGGRLAASLLAIAFALWEARRNGWPSLRNPWRRW